MAEAIAKHLFPRQIYVQSAGVKKGQLDPFAVAALEEVGIELGKLVYWNGASFPGALDVVANRERLKVLGTLVGCFFVGGVVGALGFKYIGYGFTVWLALALVLLAIVPALDDMRSALRRYADR
jgi:hypothetical protein